MDKAKAAADKRQLELVKKTKRKNAENPAMMVKKAQTEMQSDGSEIEDGLYAEDEGLRDSRPPSWQPSPVIEPEESLKNQLGMCKDCNPI